MSWALRASTLVVGSSSSRTSGLQDEARGQRHPLRLPARKRVRRAPGEIAGRRVRPTPRPWPPAAGRFRDLADAQAVRDVRSHGALEEKRLLRQQRDPVAQPPGERVGRTALEPHLALGWGFRRTPSASGTCSCRCRSGRSLPDTAAPRPPAGRSLSTGWPRNGGGSPAIDRAGTHLLCRFAAGRKRTPSPRRRSPAARGRARSPWRIRPCWSRARSPS